MVDQYRVVRRRVFEEATMPANHDANRHRQNQQKLQAAVTSICDAADLSLHGYEEDDPHARKYANRIWYQLWTKIRYAGIRSQIATTEIQDIQSYFNRFENFKTSDWDIDSKGHELISCGLLAKYFLNRQFLFKEKQTIGNLPKLKRTVNLARYFDQIIRSGRSPIELILDGYRPNEVWEIHSRLVAQLDYRGPLTALHFMMDIGLQVVKPDIVLTKLMVHWDWLQSHFADVPNDLTEADIRGKGQYGSRYRYDKPFMYRRVIDLAREIVARVSPEVLRGDIGWVTRNPIREFDLFLVKYGQQPEKEFGIERTLFDGTAERPEYPSRPRCQDRRTDGDEAGSSE